MKIEKIKQIAADHYEGAWHDGLAEFATALLAAGAPSVADAARNKALEEAAEICKTWNTTPGSRLAAEILALKSDKPVADAAGASEITEQEAAEWAARNDVEHVLKSFSTQRTAIEDARTLHLLRDGASEGQAANIVPDGDGPDHSDDIAIDVFARVMKTKMAEQRAKGYDGWTTASRAVLSDLLYQCVEKGDPRDVAIVSMMLWSHGATIMPYESEWIDASEQLPDVEPGKSREFIIVCERASSGKRFVFAAEYANQFRLENDELEENPPLTGWYMSGLDISGEYSEVYEPVCNGTGDEVLYWQPLPEPPPVVEASKAA